MSTDALNWAKHFDAGSPTKKAILMLLADYADSEWSCFPSQATLARQASVGERTVRRVLSDWEQSGLIRRVHRGSRDRKGRISDRIFLQPPGVDLPATGDDLPATDDTFTGQSLAGEPSVEPSEEPLTRDPYDDPNFVAFWDEMPKKRGKRGAWKAWKKLMREGVDPERLIAAAVAYRKLIEYRNTEDRFIKHPQGWLNEGYWEEIEDPDELEAQRQHDYFNPPPPRFI